MIDPNSVARLSKQIELRLPMHHRYPSAAPDVALQVGFVVKPIWTNAVRPAPVGLRNLEFAILTPIYAGGLQQFLI
jgi:hypothetical protein